MHQKEEHYFHFRECVLHYVKAGSGKKVLLLFHGFGQDHKAFDKIVDTQGHNYRVYAFDLFFHGKSEWPYGEKPLEKDFWVDCMGAFLGQEQISQFSVGGFSLGARFAMALTEAFPNRTEHLILMAPDGIKTSVWYSLATYPILLRRFFRSMVAHPQRFFALAKFFMKLPWMDKGLIRFAESQMNTEEKRNRVYYSWVVFRHIKINTKELSQHINQHQIPMTMILGEHDKVITHKNMERFISRVNNPKVIVFNTGHNGLISQIAINDILEQD